MKSNFEIRIKRLGQEQTIPMRCTLYQAKRVADPLAYALVEQDCTSVEVWLKTPVLEKRLCKYGLRVRG